MYKSVPISMLRVGGILASPIFDRDNTKLLSAGIAITEALLEKLDERGVRSVTIDQRDYVRLCSYQPQGTSKNCLPDRRITPPLTGIAVETDLDERIDQAESLSLSPQGDPFVGNIRQHAATSYDPSYMNDFLECHQQTLDQLDTFVTALAGEDTVAFDQVESISNDALMRSVEDKDLFICLGINPAADDQFSRHSLHVAMLAMSIGTSMGLDKQTLIELGIGCLIHDVGMLQVDQQTVKTRRVLDESEFVEIMKHPMRTFHSLQKAMDQVPATSRMVAYQMHERCNGLGYPRGRMAPQIHDLAKIAAVADVFTALVSPRPYRPGMMPYCAITKILHDVAEGFFDSTVVRALLETISLFPVGSYVALDDGRIGKVIRSNGKQYHRPTVEVWRRDALCSQPDVINLAETNDLNVVRPLSRLQ